MSTIQYACYDLFDTVLLRRCITPSDVFRNMYWRLPDILDHPPTFTEDAFVSARIMAERQARVGRAEVHLHQIWGTLAQMLSLPIAEQGALLEQSCEEDVLYPNADFLDEIRQRRHAGQQIVYISDMYLPEDLLRRILTKHALLEPQDQLFVSCVHQKTKHTGELFKAVMATLPGNGPDFQMTGDNRHSDLRMPKKLGWRARHYRKHRFNDYEAKIGKRATLNKTQHAHLLGEIRARRKSAQLEDKTPSIVGDFLGPAAFLWALWAIRKAEQEGLDRLYFMSRDAHLAWLCAKEIQNAGLTSVDCRYLYGSRFVFYSANINGRADDLDWIRSQTKNLNWPKLLKYIGLELSDFPDPLRLDLAAMDPGARLSSDTFTELTTRIRDCPAYSLVLERAATLRQHALNYLEQEGVTKDRNSAFVDIGWHLNVQSAIQDLLPQQEMKGLYIYLSESRRPPAQAGHADAMLELVADNVKTRNIPQIWHVSTVAEHLFGLTLHGTCTGYTQQDDGSIAPQTQDMSEKERLTKRPIIDAIQLYARQIAPRVVPTFTDTTSCAEAFRAVTDVFFETPTLAAIKDLNSTIRLSSDARNEDSRPMISPVSLSDIASVASMLAGGKREGRFDWLAAKLVISPRPISYGNSALRLARQFM